MKLGLVADDMTGLAAMASELVSRARPVPLTPLEAADPSGDFWGVDLACRNTDGATCGDRTRRAIDRLLSWGAGQIVVKVDSRWRGHPDAMIDAARAFAPLAVFHDSFEPTRHPDVAHAGGTDALRCPETLRAAHESGVKIWVGALSLARAVVWVALENPDPVLALVGSTEPISGEQVNLCLRAGMRRHHDRCDVASVADDLQRGRNVIITHGAAPNGGVRDAERAFARWARILRALPVADCSGLLLTGGHTASTVLAEAGVSMLHVTGNSVLPGLPICRIVGQPWPGIPVVTKPGHFGSDTTLMEAVMVLQLRGIARPDVTT